MKKIPTLETAVLLLAISSSMSAQMLPTGSPPIPTTSQQALNAWYRGGNNPTPNFNNIFGTRFGSGIFTITDNINRMRLNGNVAYPVGGFAGARNGFLLLGPNSGVTGGSLYGTANRGAFSLLHLNSGVGAFAQEGGYRPWMNFGITSTHNQDFMFLGQRATNGIDITDAVFGWADNGGPGPVGPDNMVFSFFAGDATSIGAPNGDLTGTANFGREIVRYTAGGNVGIGPRFNNANQPTSTLHQHQENNRASWMQITNQYLTTPGPTQTAPTAITAANGLRWGILGDAIKAQNGDAFMYNQENRHLIFGTNHAVPGSILTTQERMRISSLSAPTELPGGAYSATGYNPGSNPLTDVTRIGISYLPALPLTAPLSLIHLGANTSTTNDGWRRWMEIGTFMSVPTLGGIQGANYYAGIKFTPAAITSARDAIVGWGFQPSTLTNGTTGNRLRFVFTSNTGGPLPSGSTDGLEAGHFWSDGTNTRLGVGDFFAGTDPLNTLEIRSSASSPYFGSPNGSSGLKFRNMNATHNPVSNPGKGLLALDAQGNVIYVTDSCCVSGTGNLGNICGGTPNPLPLPGWEIPMNQQNFWFAGNGGPGHDRVAIGFNPGSCSPPRARLHVAQNSGVNNDIAILSMNTTIDGTALMAVSNGGATSAQTKVAGMFQASPAGGTQQVAIYVPQNQGLVNIGFPTPSAGASAALLNVNGHSSFNGDAFPSVTGTWRCGKAGNEWFEIWATNTTIQTSDERKKTNIKPLEYGLNEIMRIKPVTFDWKNNPEYGSNIGFIAQQLREVVKEVVREGDDENRSLGVKYSDLIPVLVKGIQEQQAEIDVQVKQNSDLLRQLNEQQKQINELKEMMSSCCSNGSSEKQSGNTTSTELSDKDGVVLNQNVPNPFAEQTTISYSIPATATSAQIVFYTNTGVVLKTVEIATRGKGQMNVYANDLSNGMYSYTLFVDGKATDTKKMVKQN